MSVNGRRIGDGIALIRQAALLAVLAFAGFGTAAWGQVSGVNREVFSNLAASSLESLTNDSSFPDYPAFSEVLTGGFESPLNFDEYFGERLRALLVPPMTGSYVFWVAADDAGLLFLSSDESPGNKTQIAFNTKSVGLGAWYAHPSQQSTNVYLEAGRRYYVEALHSAGTGDDSFSVGWKLPDGTLEQPIPEVRLLPFGLGATTSPNLTASPANVTVTENGPAFFRVAVSNLDAVGFQWQRDGTDLPGAIMATYAIAQAPRSDTGARFRCLVSNPLGVAISDEAILTVVHDTSRPVLSGVANLNSNTVEVIFSEAVEPATALNYANYAISHGVVVVWATFAGSPKVVHLTTSSLRPTNYTLTVSNVRDRAAVPNTILAASQMSFTPLLKGIYRETFSAIPGRLVADLTNAPAFPSQPSSAELITTAFETTRSGANNYGQRLRARLVPPVTGEYTFWIAADDTATLFLGTNDAPASARAIAAVTTAAPVSARQWEIQPGQRSAPMLLAANQPYYIEALMKTGVSGGFPPDHLAVRWRLPDGSFEEPIPAVRLTPVGMTLPVVVTQPTNTLVVEGGTTQFGVSVSNLDPVGFQWQQNGANLPNATNATYTKTKVPLADDNSSLRCVLSNALGSTWSANALLTVIPDVTPPSITQVRNNGTNRLTVYFSEPVEGTTATNPANYSIAGVTVSAPLLSSDQQSVTLTAATLEIGRTYTLAVNRVRDRATAPNVIATNSQATFQAAVFFLEDIGASAGSSITFAEGGVNLVAGDGELGGSNDQFGFSYQRLVGDFDVKVRVQGLEFADTWTKAGLMARQTLAPDSRYAAVFTTPTVAGTFFQYRAEAGSVPQVTGAFPVNHPYTWLRLRRVGGTRFTGFASLDGQSWTELGTATLALPASIFLGFAASSENAWQTTLAQFRDFASVTGDTAGVLRDRREPLGPSSQRTGLVISEIMHHPAQRPDGRNLEFVEIYNSNPFFEDISGYRLSGDIHYTIPPGTVLPGGAFLVVAKQPAEIRAVRGASNVVGPYSNYLPRQSGLVRLANRSGATLLEVQYASDPSWPAAAGGAGHSLVLARPSLGEGRAEAWEASDRIGGSPGTMDGVWVAPLRDVVINEFVARPAAAGLDYIELFNRGSAAVDLSGCWLSDDPFTNKFRIPNGAVIGPTSRVHFAATTLGFTLAAQGEGIFFVDSNQIRVLDAVQFGGQERGVATGRSPDGAPAFSRLASATPGARNAAVRPAFVVINEIMYDPVTGDANDEFVELHNRGASAVNLGNWRLTSGIDFVFPTNTVIPAGGYLVIAKNAAHLRSNYMNLTTGNTVGNYAGSLKDSGGTVALAMPDSVVTTNLGGVVKTNQFHIVVNEVAYGRGGCRGKWSDGGGSSLELIDPHSDNRLPSNWTDSDDAAKSAWTTISASGTLDHASGANSLHNALQIHLLEAGECLIDSVLVSIAGSGNQVPNGEFENPGLDGWTFQGSHRHSRIETPGYAGLRSLRLIASQRGDPLANRVQTLLTQRYSTNVTGTISARVKWLHGKPEILLRLRGNHLEVPGVMTIPRNLGTPGARNSRYLANAGPAITEVSHHPVLPAANQPVVVTARVHDPDGVPSALLTYRVDPGDEAVTVPLMDNGVGSDQVAGDGLYSALIPGQSQDALVAFYVQATDGLSAVTRAPRDAPAQECLVRFGEAQPFGAYGTHRFWLTRASYNEWIYAPKLANEGVPITLVYGNARVIHNATARFDVSPFQLDLLDTPDGALCDYEVDLPAGERLFDAASLTLQAPGHLGRDASGQAEQTAHGMAQLSGLPSLHRRSVNVFFNGLRRGVIYEEARRPDPADLAQFVGGSGEGDLFAVQYGFETTDDAADYDSTPASLQPFLSAGGVKKLARYRQTFRKSGNAGSPHNYTNLFNLVEALNTPPSGGDDAATMFPALDIKQWAGVFALERMLNNQEFYANQEQPDKPGGQGCYLGKPDGDSWKLFPGDVDQCFSGSPTDPLFQFTDSPIANLCAKPSVLRLYWQALEDAANGAWAPATVFPGIDARHHAYLASGIAAEAPTAIMNFISARRDYALHLIAELRADFAITNHAGASFTSDTPLVTLSGTAPISARTITINGEQHILSWTSVTNWSVTLALSGQTNQYWIQAYDAQGNLLANGTRTITIHYPEPLSRPEESLVISEIMYRPAVSNASYVEIFNRSANTVFSLLNHRLEGVDFDFPPDAIIEPLSFRVVVKNVAAFQAAYGSNASIAGVFQGDLDRNDGTLALIRRAPTSQEPDVVIDQVKYEARAPWPVAAANGVALQLIDPAEDNARVSNWDDGSNWRFYSFTGRPPSTGSPRLFLWLDGAGEVYLDDLRLVLGSVPGLGSNYLRNADFETPLVNPWLMTGSPGASTTSGAFAHSGSNSLRLVFTRAGSASICLYQDLPSGVSLSSASDYTVSFWYRPKFGASSGTNLTVRLASSSGSSTAFSPVLDLNRVTATPGDPNWVAGTVTPYQLLWINEVQPSNMNGLRDSTGTPQPWIELFNSGTNTISLDGCYLTDNYSNLTQWAFPPDAFILPGQFQVLFVDGQPHLSTGDSLHTSFRLNPVNGSIALSRGRQILDYVNYTNMAPDMSAGSWPDGQLFERQLFYQVTPGAANNPAPIPISINEWMTGNTRTRLNPVTGEFDGWFELHNSGATSVSLGGYFLADDLGTKTKWRIPAGTGIAPYGFLLCWAGGVTHTNLVGNALHTGLHLERDGGEIGLFSPEGLPVDAVSFGPQNNDVSQGRYSDGNIGGAYYVMSMPTPGTANVITNNSHPPALAAIPDYALNEGTPLTLQCAVTDADGPAQSLRYALEGAVPEGADIHPLTGVFTWTPMESHDGAYTITIRANDGGQPPLSDARSFRVTVNEVNSAPLLGAIADVSIDPGLPLSLPIPAADPDIPAQALAFALLAGPLGAEVDPDGFFMWTPTPTQARSTNLVIVRATDGGVPSLSATQSFFIFVNPNSGCQGLKGDVAPRLDGNGTVTVSDWVQVGRFASGLADISNACELARADCAPKPCGNGTVSISDWVQAGRYVAGLDPLAFVTECPPSGGGFLPAAAPGAEAVPPGLPLRVLSATSMVLAHGETNRLQILLHAQGDEAGIGFSLSYDPNLLTLVSTELGPDATDAVLHLNTNQAALGRIGLILALPTGAVFAAGSRLVAEVCFRATPGTRTVATPITFGHEPIVREICDIQARALPTDYENGTAVVYHGNDLLLRATRVLGADGIRVDLIGRPGVWELQGSQGDGNWAKIINLINQTGWEHFIDPDFTKFEHRFYRGLRLLP